MFVVVVVALKKVNDGVLESYFFVSNLSCVVGSDSELIF